ncbi:MAG: hypothetical protein N2Z20_05420 [Elusimicrobiales bacterium]|nr:hypothetical protein [Elusimicrobiales bacterium]
MIRLIFILLFHLLLPYEFLYSEKSQNFSSDMKEVIDIEWENAEIIDHPVYGVLILSKDRWKNWVFRSTIVIMVYISISTILLAIPKSSEFNFIISYILCGSMFVLSFWLSLCGWMLNRLGTFKYGWLFIFLSLPMCIGSYFMTLRTKKYDISYSKIKDEIKKLKEEEMKNYQDPRLYAISGMYGEWEDEDFIRGG